MVEEMELPEWNPHDLYRYLYYNPLLKRSYILGFDSTADPEMEIETGKLLILDEQMNLLKTIHVDSPSWLDFVIE